MPFVLCHLRRPGDRVETREPQACGGRGGRRRAGQEAEPKGQPRPGLLAYFQARSAMSLVSCFALFGCARGGGGNHVQSGCSALQASFGMWRKATRFAWMACSGDAFEAQEVYSRVPGAGPRMTQRPWASSAHGRVAQRTVTTSRHWVGQVKAGRQAVHQDQQVIIQSTTHPGACNQVQ